ncbi:DUF1501 domain-containing protein [Undibacterium oligocarboniphilum]|uniref:DUF1501 domain-containing protein n=1 Tax=Undibacterium oligocarboniphilum TaxID=666702 RepID=A0A850QK39_9BURK|nr:DUF1501 domain-containing protein [Undibacterium oligocarboniphilum]MBC3869526.1 DUF1501 domain-containing protein [Undibacterium oligocarboniphilum]NVO77905.1 DUF1501 domain-containing protein [Undibacterium oligocarboniphilum]
MDRRQLLQRMAALTALPALSYSSQLLAAPTVQNKLLLVFLRGGYDACHLLVPTGSSFYYESRPNIAIARPGTGADSALALNADWGLHPVLRDSIYPLYLQNEIAFVPFAGTDDLSRSHFETQDSIELGQPLNGRRDFHSGFMNRLAAVLNSSGGPVPAMAFTDQLPLAMQGQAEVVNTAVRNISRQNLDARQSQLIEKMYGQTGLAQQVNEGFTVRQEVAREMQEEMDAANRNAITTKSFTLEAQRIAKMMRDKYTLGFVDIGGWDTHVDQGAAKGMLAGKLDELGRGLTAFRDGMGSQWQQTTVVVISEFGRTFRENGKRGTDHGHGSVYWVMGGNVRGGQILGEQISLTPGQLFQNRDYPVLNEYRAILGGLFGRLYGLNSQQLNTVFQGVRAKEIGLL